MTLLIAPPTRVPPLDGLPNPFAREWRDYLQTLQNVGQASPQILQEASIAGNTAAIPTTLLALPSVSAGFYRVSVYFLVTIPAGVTSSLQVTIGWTDHGLAASRVIPALVNGALAANGGDCIPLHVDDNSPITYTVAYASNPANQMTYDLGVIAEQLA